MLPLTHLSVLQRIRAEYREMPGMRLNVEQVERLCGVERAVCQMVLDALLDAKFLSLKSDGVYARFTEESRPPRRPGEGSVRA